MLLLAWVAVVWSGPAGPDMLDVTEGNGYWPVTACLKDQACQAWKIATKDSSVISTT